MGNVYTAEEYEAEVARAQFGKKVTTVVYYDPEFPRDGDPWYAVAYDGDGNEIGSRQEGDETLVEIDGMTIFDAVGERGETVKFWLEIPAPECEGHESLDGAHMGETVYCDGSCV